MEIEQVESMLLGGADGSPGQAQVGIAEIGFRGY